MPVTLSAEFINDWTGICRPRRRFEPRKVYAEIDDTFLGAKTSNVTGADLGIHELYEVSLWSYCYSPRKGTRVCSRPSFDWARYALDRAVAGLGAAVETTGGEVTLPSYITGGASSFRDLIQ
jgi:hypothetical protein